MTVGWLIAAMAVGFFLLGLQTAALIFQYTRNIRLEKRLTSFGHQLKNVPKRRSDRVADSVVD